MLIYSFERMTAFPQGTLIWQRFTNVSWDSFDPQRENLFGEDSIRMVNVVETPRVIVFFIT